MPENKLLAALPPAVLAELEPMLECADLQNGDVLYEPHQPIEFVYFPVGGLFSKMAVNKDGSRSEVGCVGREGLCGIPVLLGAVSSPHYAFVQIGGPALRIKSSALKSAMEAHPSLRRRLLRYVHVFMLQVAATDLADSRYGLEQRLARWLLMCQDRVEHDEMPLTHEMLSAMIGSRRSGVTVTLHKLEGERIIKAERGWITVLNRPRLLEVAGDSYGVPEAEYQRLLSEC